MEKLLICRNFYFVIMGLAPKKINFPHERVGFVKETSHYNNSTGSQFKIACEFMELSRNRTMAIPLLY